jgi:hypothetical protein
VFGDFQPGWAIRAFPAADARRQRCTALRAQRVSAQIAGLALLP